MSQPTGEPKQIGPFILESVLGRGGMGVVYHGREESSQHQVALKTVLAPRIQPLVAIRREIRALSRARHPGVVRILDQGLHHGLPWYAMEFVLGESLKEYRQRLAEEGQEPDPRYWKEAAAGRLPDVLTLVRRLCAPLAFLHGEGLVHRDLKPANVILRPDGSPVLVDFGLAARFSGASGREPLTVAGTMAGSCAYMSPEQIRGEYVDARADLYSLGCLLYELLTGHPPFPGTMPIQILQAHLRQEPEPPSRFCRGIPPGLDELVLRLLAKEPRRRVGFADDLAQALIRLGALEETRTGPPPRSYLYRAGFTGRGSEFRQLLEGLKELVQGRGGLHLLTGESGVGKTRLALEVARKGRMQGVRVLTGEGGPAVDQSPRVAPLHPLRRTLRALADHCREEGDQEARAILGDWGSLLAQYEPSLASLPWVAEQDSPADLPPEAARLRLVRALEHALSALAAREPILLVLDDLQWADELTLDLLAHLNRGDRLESLSLLILGLYRVEEAGARLERQLEAEPNQILQLKRLEDESLSAMVGDMLALGAPPSGLTGYVTGRSRGNPFLLTEYLRSAVEQELLTRDQRGDWQIAAVGYEDLPLPSGLKELVYRRLTGLEPKIRRVLEGAAVLEGELEPDLLTSLVEIDEPEVMDALHEMVRRRILVEPGPGRLSFAYHGIRQMVGESLPEDRLRELHLRAARTLEELLQGGREASAGELGRHWEAAGEPSRARRWYRSGAEEARQRLAFQESEQLCRAHLALSPEADEKSVAVRRFLADQLLLRQGRNDEAREELQVAMSEAVGLEDRNQEARIHISQAGLAERRGSYSDARGSLEAALAISRQIGDRPLEGEILSLMGSALFELKSEEEAFDSLNRALTIHRETGNLEQEGNCLSRLGLIYTQLGRLDRAIPLHEQAIRIHREAGNHHREAVALANFVPLLASQGQMEEARRVLEQALEIFRRIGERRLEGRVLANLASAELELNHLTQAEARSREAIAILREVGEPVWEGISLINLGVALNHQTRRQEARDVLERAWELVQANQDRATEGVVLFNLGAVLSDLGRPRRARRYYRDALRILREARHRYYEAHTLTGLAELERRTGGDLDRAEEWALQAADIFRELENPAGQRSILLQRAHLALARGQDPEPSLLAKLEDDEWTGLLAGRLEALQRALDARARGASLLAGEEPEAIPPELRRWILARREDLPPATAQTPPQE